MCGIAGVLNINQKPVNQVDLKRMTDAIIHRGPESEGFWVSNNIGFGHRRLAIIDLSENGRQPMHFFNRYVITFNGEIYNYIELKQTIEQQGVLFFTNSDTEVLLALYHVYREKMLEFLDGMFAFSIWDSLEKVLFCARDRFGEKPFYYNYQPNNSFIFASEMKSLFAFGLQKNVNHEQVFNYLAYDLLDNPEKKSDTFFNSVNKLQPAHYIKITKDKFEVKKYWSLNTKIDASISFDSACVKVKELLTESVKKRLRSDVPIGTSLSGGLDSSTIVCLINSLNHNKEFQQNTFSARFNSPEFDEGKYINEIVNLTKTKSYQVYNTENTFLDNLDKIYFHHEVPIGGPSVICQWDVMKLAKENNTTVLLDGQGADEVFAGYLKYFWVYLSEIYCNDKTFYKSENEAVKLLHQKDYSVGFKRKTEIYAPFIKNLALMFLKSKNRANLYNGISSDLLAYKKNLPFKTFDSLNETLCYDTTVYGLEKLLKVGDRNSTAFSREVRCPFLSHKLVEYIFSLPASFKMNNGWTKYVLRKSFEDLLPLDITWRVDKKGYQPPYSDWLNNKKMIELINDAKEKLIKERIINKEINSWKMIDIYQLIK